jgi:hypothetical protein
VVQVGAGQAERARVVIRSNSPVPPHSAEAQSLIGWMITSPGDLSCCGIRRYFLGTGHAAAHHSHGAVAALSMNGIALFNPRRWRSPVTDTRARS